MPAKKKPSYYIAKEGFVTMLDGEQTAVAAGDLVHPDHPLLKRRMEHFEPVDDHVRFDVEQATVAPGEKRGEEKK